MRNVHIPEWIIYRCVNLFGCRRDGMIFLVHQFGFSIYYLKQTAMIGSTHGNGQVNNLLFCILGHRSTVASKLFMKTEGKSARMKVQYER